MSKRYSIWFHYNKPESKRQGRNVLTVHYRGACHPVNEIRAFGVDLQSKDRATQPRCVMQCKGVVSFINEGDRVIAEVTG